MLGEETGQRLEISDLLLGRQLGQGSHGEDY
jgi:hypothetical protein